ncbi:MAG: hypothetical protein RMI91_09355 [Gemmatales bacterium]|nr:hypothetical protein [Gemmatales bacterium]MDW7994847.1 hypothetical protein [Gemmatales bacterium]
MSRVIFHLLGVFITAFLLVCLVFSQEKPTTTPSTVPSPHHDLLILTEERPLLLRLNIFLNGRPINEHWRERSGKVFQFLDTNRDGTLSREEASRLNMVIFPHLGGGALPVDFDRDGRITQEEFQRWLYEMNSGPVAIRPYYTMANPNYGIDEIYGNYVGQVFESVSRRLFRQLDLNRDDKLDSQELDQAEHTLAALDEDEDEAVTPTELPIGFASAQPPAGNNANPPRVVVNRPPPTPQSGLFLLHSEGSLSNAVRSLQITYSRQDVAIPRRRLSREELNLPPDLFRQCDKDADGSLDAEELHLFLRRTPDAEITLHLDEPTKERPRPRARFVEARARFGWQAARTEDEITLGLEKTRIRISPNSWLTAISQRSSDSGQASLTNFIELSLKNHRAVFQRADADQNGYLDEQEFNRIRLSAPLLQTRTFAQLDRDNDGKIFERELLALAREPLEIQFWVREMSLPLAMMRQGPNLFRTLDLNGDGKLGLSEQRQAARILRGLDRNGDGTLEWTELSSHYQLDIGSASGVSELSPLAAPPMGTPLFPPVSQPRPPRRDVPTWFRAMDRNGDGDISRREFPGSEAEFRQLDADGNGYITLEEALAAVKKQLSVPEPAK